MTHAILKVSGPDLERRVSLDPRGLLVGRSSGCDLALPNGEVSRQHARLFQDPFGRWIIEDLNSRPGVWVEGRRIEARALLVGEKITIGPYCLTLVQEPDRRIAADPAAFSTQAYVAEDSKTEIIAARPESVTALSSGRLKQLNEITDRLVSRAGPSDLYPELCRCLAAPPKAAALVLRLPDVPGEQSTKPETLACHIAGVQGTQAGAATGMRLSHRVLEAVRSENRAVMAGNVRLAEEQMELTLIDQARPRTVVCAPVTDGAPVDDVLYADVPSDEAGADFLDFIQAIARQVNFVRKSLLLAEANAERRVLDQQIELARQIQVRLMPSRVEGIPGVDVAFRYEPAMWVGGDYCDMWRLEDGRLAFAVGDVSGHGLGAAMVMANLHAALRNTMSFCTQPGQILQHITRYLCRHTPGNVFVTLVLGLFDPASGQLEYVNAGHILPFVVSLDGTVSQLGEPRHPPLGITESVFETDTILLAAGEALVVVTDGITEAGDPDSGMFGTERLREILAAAGPAPSNQIVASVAETAADFRQPLPQQDDVTVFAMRRLPDA